MYAVHESPLGCVLEHSHRFCDSVNQLATVWFDVCYQPHLILSSGSLRECTFFVAIALASLELSPVWLTPERHGAALGTSTAVNHTRRYRNPPRGICVPLSTLDSRQLGAPNELRSTEIGHYVEKLERRKRSIGRILWSRVAFKNQPRPRTKSAGRTRTRARGWRIIRRSEVLKHIVRVGVRSGENGMVLDALKRLEREVYEEKEESFDSWSHSRKACLGGFTTQLTPSPITTCVARCWPVSSGFSMRIQDLVH